MSNARGIVSGGRGPSARRLNITLGLVSSCLLVACLSCPSETARSLPPASDGTELAVFLTGNELGSLRPCGCSGGQLGGLEKRSAVFDRAPASHRLILDTGNLVANDGEQDLIKFSILFEAFKLLDYDVVCLTDRDIATAERLGLLVNPPQAFAILKGGKADSGVFTKQFSDLGVTVNVASLDFQTTPVEQAVGLFGGAGGPSTVNILVLHQHDDSQLPDITAKLRGIDCVVCPSDSDEPRVLSEPGTSPLVVTAGRFGRHIGRLRVAIPSPGGKPVLQFDRIPVSADLPDDPDLAQLYRRYQQLVGAAHLLESYPRIPLPEGLAYTGSGTCKRCHEYESEQWSTKAHAEALNSLKRVGSDRDPECVICHVVGMEYESGYVTEEKTPHLKDVGCENCHGPGSEHVKSFGQKATGQPQMRCRTCHTPERSSGFAGHEEEYMQKIVHWREPAAAGNVKH